MDNSQPESQISDADLARLHDILDSERNTETRKAPLEDGSTTLSPDEIINGENNSSSTTERTHEDSDEITSTDEEGAFTSWDPESETPPAENFERATRTRRFTFSKLLGRHAVRSDAPQPRTQAAKDIDDAADIWNNTDPSTVLRVADDAKSLDNDDNESPDDSRNDQKATNKDGQATSDGQNLAKDESSLFNRQYAQKRLSRIEADKKQTGPKKSTLTKERLINESRTLGTA